MSKAAAQLASFGQYFFASGFGKGKNHFLIFQWVQERNVVLIINDDNGENRP